MTICEFLTDEGSPPANCSLLRKYLDAIAATLSEVNQIRCTVTFTADPPSEAGLNALWAPCSVPDNAMVFWHYRLISTENYYQYFYDGTNWVLLDLRIV
jgi:hypothetical protein